MSDRSDLEAVQASVHEVARILRDLVEAPDAIRAVRALGDDASEHQVAAALDAIPWGPAGPADRGVCYQVVSAILPLRTVRECRLVTQFGATPWIEMPDLDDLPDGEKRIAGLLAAIFDSENAQCRTTVRLASPGLSHKVATYCNAPGDPLVDVERINDGPS